MILRCPHCRKALGVVDGLALDKEKLVRKVAKQTKVGESEILGRSRNPRIVRARHLVWRSLREKGYSYPEIARSCGVNHSSVQYACKVSPFLQREHQR